ncbi:hypothetical protein J3A83DRAFT_4241369 [Scleroderma citrinum]
MHPRIQILQLWVLACVHVRGIQPGLSSYECCGSESQRPRRDTTQSFHVFPQLHSCRGQDNCGRLLDVQKSTEILNAVEEHLVSTVYTA